MPTDPSDRTEHPRHDSTGREPDPMGRWIRSLSADLGIDDDIDVRRVLDVARGAARGVARPAAPVTAFLLGLALGRSGGTAETDLPRLADRVEALLPADSAQGEQGGD